jgi:putative CGCGG family rSAM target protein
MTSVSRNGVEPATDRVHHNPWSATPEKPKHDDDPALVAAQAIDAVNFTAVGHRVKLVIPGNHGHPREFLFPAFTVDFGDDLEWEHVVQCRCGDHVIRVHVE